MNFNTLARRAPVQLPGGIWTEGYILPEKLWTKTNKYGVSKTGAALICYPEYERQQAASRYIWVMKSKAAQKLVPQGIVVHENVSVEGQNQLADLIPVDQLKFFFKICRKLGSEIADQLCDHLMDTSLQEYFADAFEVSATKEDRQALLDAWYPIRELSVVAHKAFDNACKRKRHPGKYVHDLMTTLIFGDTAAAARLKAIVAEQLDATIGLNHQEDVDKLNHLVWAKIKYSDLRKGTWQEQVERAVAESTH